ncbi:MAG: sulfatase [Planctomycetota bacterium]|jgi:arylsulfatase A-like enzyme
MKRRDFIRTIGMTVAAVATPQWALAEKRSRKPNIVLIFIDDMGYKDVGFNGSKYYLTPNIDRLAAEGMIFKQGYVCAANCAPSRACLLSGQFTPRHKLYAVNTIRRGNKYNDRLALTDVEESKVLPAETVTFAEALKKAGYATAMFGKWHLGNFDGENGPGRQGFDTALPTNPPKAAKFKETGDPKEIFLYTDRACRFIEENKGRPFMVYLSHHAIHMGIQARAEMIEKFKAREGVGGQDDPGYAAYIAHTDEGVGQLMDKLKALGLDEDTVVIFLSDNGGIPKSSQLPLRGLKGMYYEGGVRIPFAVRWKGQTRANSTCDTPVCAADLYPTFLELAGAEPPKGQPLDGSSIVPLLKGRRALEDRPIFWHFPGYLYQSGWTGSRDPLYRTRPVSVVRKGKWKLMMFLEEWSLDGGWDKRDTNNSIELYNIPDDISEKNNLAQTMPEKRDQMLRELTAWQKRANAPIPQAPNPQYDPKAKQEKKKRRQENRRKP